ncbi:MAG: ATP-binding protein [Acidobacteriota bacterium]
MSKTPARVMTRRREMSSLVPAAILLLAVLSTFTLFSYRSAVDLLLEGRRSEAQSMARRLSIRLASEPGSLAGAVRLLDDLPLGLAVLDARGRVLVSSGPVSVLTTEPAADVVRAHAAFRRRGEQLEVRVELPAGVLRSRERSLSLLTPLVLGVDFGVLVLVLIFVRRRLLPIDRVLERARRLGVDAASDDELGSVVQTVERALDVLASVSADPLVALGSTLGSQLESGVVLCDDRGRVLAVNARGTAILEIEPPAPSTPLEAALAPHDELAAALRATISGGESLQRAELGIEAASGRRELGLTVHPLRREDPQGNTAPHGFLVLFADLTDMQRRQAERSLAESLARLGELTAGIAHEMRNSLASLVGHLTLLERAPASEREESLADLRHEVSHLQRVVDDFLSFARPGSVRLSEVDLVALLHRVAADPVHHGAMIRVSAPETPVAVAGDHQLLERVLQNLVTNAVQATREGAAADEPESTDATAIELRLASDDPVRVEVLDRGGGVPAELADKVFDPFVSGRVEGTGLGLAIARRVAALHGGSLTLEPRPGGGSVARLELPPKSARRAED